MRIVPVCLVSPASSLKQGLPNRAVAQHGLDPPSRLEGDAPEEDLRREMQECVSVSLDGFNSLVDFP